MICIGSFWDGQASNACDRETSHADGMIKIIMKLKIKKAIPFIFLLYGLFYFLEPVLSGYFEVFDPFIARAVFLPIRWITFFLFSLPLVLIWREFAVYAPDVVFLIFFLTYIFFFFKTLRTETTGFQKKIATSCLFVFPLLFIVMLPLGATSSDRHINSFALGGWSLLGIKGGAAEIREESIRLFNSTTKEDLSGSELPSTLREIGGWAKLEHDNGVIVLDYSRMFNMADKFGFVFQVKPNERPYSRYVNGSYFHRYWKLADGVYLFESD
jgi:hypothetical protein